jgi:hypothetical protein
LRTTEAAFPCTGHRGGVDQPATGVGGPINLLNRCRLPATGRHR